jgi:hypothetical protein
MGFPGFTGTRRGYRYLDKNYLDNGLDINFISCGISSCILMADLSWDKAVEKLASLSRICIIRKSDIYIYRNTIGFGNQCVFWESGGGGMGDTATRVVGGKL